MLRSWLDLARSLVSRDDEDGQGLAEYALILALIAIVAIVALLFLGSQISDKLSIVGNAIASRSALIAQPAGPSGGLSVSQRALATCHARQVSGCRHTPASLQRTLR